MFTQIKCPSCGAECDIDEGREFAFCSFCGTKMFNQPQKIELSGTIKIDGAPSVDNLLLRARMFREDGDYGRSLQYYEQALDIDAGIQEARRAVDEITGTVRRKNLFVLADQMTKRNIWGNKREFITDVCLDGNRFITINKSRIGYAIAEVGRHVITASVKGRFFEHVVSINTIDQTIYVTISNVNDNALFMARPKPIVAGVDIKTAEYVPMNDNRKAVRSFYR